MADEKKPDADTDAPSKQPWGPGMLLLFAVGLAVVAFLCGRDFLGFSARSQEAWENGERTYLAFNGAGLALGAIGSVWSLILAWLRSRKQPGPPDS